MFKPYRSLLSSAALVLSAFLSSSLSAQQAPPDPTPLATHPAAGNIILDVAVTTRNGQSVGGLTKQDFTVLDNKQTTPILSFAAHTLKTEQDEPVEVTIVIDEVNTGVAHVAFEHDQIRNYVRKSGGELNHPTRLAFLSDTGTEIQRTTTTNGSQLVAAFDQHVTRLHTIQRTTGFYGAVERFQLSIGMLSKLAAEETSTPGRKVIVWISPGWPMLIGTQSTLTTAERRGLFESMKSLSTDLRRARITLYSIDPIGVQDAATSRTFYYQGYLKPVSDANKVEVANLGLQVIAVQSGGLVLNSSNDLAGQIAGVVKDADSFYTLTIAPGTGDKPDAFRSVEVRTTHPDATVRTRNGYYPEQ